jgi:MFS family permease
MTRTERTYYFLTCLYRLSWSVLGPTYALFLLGRGLDILQVNLVLAVYLTTTCLFEVPTGAFADVFGRKRSFILSCLLRALAFGLYFFAHRFDQFLVAEFIDAIGTTLTTGALDAWAVDGIRDEGAERPADRLFARANIFGQTTAIIGGLSAAQLAEHDLALPWLVGATGFLISALMAALFMRERRSRVDVRVWRQADVLPSIGSALRDTVGALRTLPVLRGLCLLSVLTSFATVPAFQMWQPRIQQLAGQGPWLLGWVWVLLNLATIAGSALIPTLLRRCGRARALAVACAWRAIALGGAALATSFTPVLIGFVSQQVAFGFNEPIEQAWMNEHASSGRRATILSLHSMAFTLGGAIGLVCLGWVARETDIANAWRLSAGVSLLAAPGFLVLGSIARRYKRLMVKQSLHAGVA